MASRTPLQKLPFPALATIVAAYGAAAALLASAFLVPGPALVAGCTMLAILLVGAGWMVRKYYASSQACEFPVGDLRRDLADHATSRPLAHRLSRSERLRHLSEIRSLTRRLIDAANRADGSATAPRESRSPAHSPVPIARAERALLESVRAAMTRGMEGGAIRAEGFEQAVSAAIAMSELAYVVIERMRTRLGASAIA